MKNLVFVLCAIALVVSSAAAQQAPDPMKGGESETYIHVAGRDPIPDNTYDGTLGTMVCLDATGTAGTITDLDVEVAISHTWAGDLVIKLVSPSSEVLTLMSRPGLAEPADDGTDCCGDSSNLDISFPLTFDDDAAISAEAMGSTLDSAGVICQDDAECDFAPAPDTGPGTNLAQFNGQDGAGTWQVCVGDSGGGDTGDFDSVVLNFAVQQPPTPTPSGPAPVPTTSRAGIAAMMVLLGLAALVILRRRMA
jgi:subtilisin-like proprotein convertase family protein